MKQVSGLEEEKGEPYIDAVVANLDIELGAQNWCLADDDGYEDSEMTSGEITVHLPNGTRIDIQASVDGDWNRCSIHVFHMKDTEITIFERSSKITKRARKIDGVSRFTKIRKVIE